jgi:hypothetical protein
VSGAPQGHQQQAAVSTTTTAYACLSCLVDALGDIATAMAGPQYCIAGNLCYSLYQRHLVAYTLNYQLSLYHQTINRHCIG